MKTISKMIAALAAMTAFTASATYALGNPPATNSVLANASAMIVTPVTITQQGAGLSFGTFAVSPTVGGTIDSTGTASGGVNALPGTGAAPATFVTSGVPGNSYTIVGPATVPLNGLTGATMSAALTYPQGTRTLTGGSDTFNVSGLLTVPAGQQADTYSGTYTVSVHY